MQETELGVYEENDFLDKIGDHVPKFGREELMNNNYKVYYRTYSLWKNDCQNKYST